MHGLFVTISLAGIAPTAPQAHTQAHILWGRVLLAALLRAATLETIEMSLSRGLDKWWSIH